jgi:hypothetical protein
MKVLQKGPNPEQSKELRCRGYGVGETAGCGALLLVSPSDVKSEHRTDYTGDSDIVYYFVCPECGVWTYTSYNTFSRS